MIKRTITPQKNRSYFLFGPRQTGKSTFVKAHLGPKDLYINLLPQRTFLAYAKEPGIFRDEVLAHFKRNGPFVCVVDEIQKIPSLLDEVHDLIESYGIHFILTGSSARKLKRGAANLLAGRANTYHLYPLTYAELGANFDLERTLLIGGLPYLWSSSLEGASEREFLYAYVDTYLREEIQEGGLVRKIVPFAQFLDIAAANDGEIANFSNIARECGVSVKTIQEYYQILEDTFLAYKIPPWNKSVRSRLVAHPRFYLFDTGVTNALCHHEGKLHPHIRGRRFEQWIITQLVALNSYYRTHAEFYFWRTNTGSEIDLLIVKGNEVRAAIEIKSTALSNLDLSALHHFAEEYPQTKRYIVGAIERPRLHDSGVWLLPWQDLLTHVFREICEA